MDIHDYAHEIGWEGLRIGAAGLKIAMKAIGGVFKLVFTSYDSDDLERDLEREAAKLEARAEQLEEEAEVLEDMANALERQAEKLARDIPELGDLGWF